MKAAIATRATTNAHKSLLTPSGVDKKNKPKNNSTAQGKTWLECTTNEDSRNGTRISALFRQCEPGGEGGEFFVLGPGGA